MSHWLRAMTEFDGAPCDQCGTIMDMGDDNRLPTWDDDDDSAPVVCSSCAHDNKKGTT